MNPKTLQYLMGHSDIGVTLNAYTHLKYDDAKAEVLKMADSQRISKKMRSAKNFKLALNLALLPA